jgi:hypothetical protein
MATLTELHTLAGSPGILLPRIQAALTIKAYSLITAQATAPQIAWAKSCLAEPAAYAGIVLRSALAANAAATTAQITAATDEAIQGVVGNVVDNLLAK